MINFQESQNHQQNSQNSNFIKSPNESVVFKSNKSLSDDNTVRFSYDLYGQQQKKINQNKPIQRQSSIYYDSKISNTFKNNQSVNKFININKKMVFQNKNHNYQTFFDNLRVKSKFNTDRSSIIQKKNIQQKSNEKKVNQYRNLLQNNSLSKASDAVKIKFKTNNLEENKKKFFVNKNFQGENIKKNKLLYKLIELKLYKQ